MRLDHLRELYRYNDWATAQVLTRLRTVPPEVFVRDLGSSFASLRDTFAHLAAAEWIWLERWHGHNPTAPPPWAASPDLAVLEAALQDVAQQRVAYLATLAEASLDAVLHFHLLSGSPEHHVLYDLLVHVVAFTAITWSENPNPNTTSCTTCWSTWSTIPPTTGGSSSRCCGRWAPKGLPPTSSCSKRRCGVKDPDSEPPPCVSSGC